MDNKKPEITIFAGPNGSGKSTITEVLKPTYYYSNADDYQRVTGCSALEAAEFVEKERYDLLKSKQSFAFETVLSTDRYLKLLKIAKNSDYFIRSFFVLTENVSINILRVHARELNGGHTVPTDKIISRYYKSLDNLPELIQLSDICNVYDNSTRLIKRIYKKDLHGSWYNKARGDFWGARKIKNLTKDFKAKPTSLN